MSPMFTCLQVILRHSGIDCLMISRAKLIPVVLGGIATLETLETKWVLPKNRPGPAAVFDVAGCAWLTGGRRNFKVLRDRSYEAPPPSFPLPFLLPPPFPLISPFPFPSLPLEIGPFKSS